MTFLIEHLRRRDAERASRREAWKHADVSGEIKSPLTEYYLARIYPQVHPDHYFVALVHSSLRVSIPILHMRVSSGLEANIARRNALFGAETSERVLETLGLEWLENMRYLRTIFHCTQSTQTTLGGQDEGITLSIAYERGKAHDVVGLEEEFGTFRIGLDPYPLQAFLADRSA